MKQEDAEITELAEKNLKMNLEDLCLLRDLCVSKM